MRTGILIIGIAVFLAAMFVLICSSIAVLYAYQKVSGYETPMGQISRAFSPSQENSYQTFRTIEIGSVILALASVMIALIGAMISIAGLVLNKPVTSINK